MNIRIEPYLEAHAPAALAFNERIRGAADFGVAAHAPRIEPEFAPIRHHHYLALEGDAVRGGLLLASFHGWFADGETADVWNAREPLSEGIVDSKYTFLAIQILKYIQQQAPYAFALGMGGEQLPFPRLLRGAGWTVLPVPFLFRVFSPNRFARELRLLQRGPVKTLARVAAVTGLAALGTTLLQARLHTAAPREYSIEPVDRWGSWADEIWTRFRTTCSFSVTRDRETLAALYPLGQKIRAHVVKRGSAVAGWAATMNTPMNNHKYFGNLRVGTILDCVAAPGDMPACIALAARSLARDGADLAVTNQSHADIVKAFRRIGFLTARSNYILAVSKKFSQAIVKNGGLDRAHFTRGDSDGRIHL